MELEPGLNSDPQVDEAFRGLMDQSGRSVLWDRKFIGGDLTAKSLTRETEMVGTQRKKERKKKRSKRNYLSPTNEDEVILHPKADLSKTNNVSK